MLKFVVLIGSMVALSNSASAAPSDKAGSNADYLQAAELAVVRGELSKGVQLLSHVDASTCGRDKLADFLFLKGDIASQQRSFSEAIPYLKRANAIRSDYRTLHDLVIGFFELGDYVSSTNAALRALILKPDDPYLYWYLGRSRAHMGKLQEAIDIFTKSLTIADPASGIYKDTLRERAAVYMAMELPEQAKKDLVELNKLPLGKNCTLGGIYSISFKYSRDLGRYLRDAGRNPTLAELKRLKEKIVRNTKPEELKDLHLHEAELELYLGHYERALELVGQLQKQGDDSYRVHSIKSAALFGLKQFDQAKDERRITIDSYISQRFNGSKASPPTDKSPDSGKVQHL